jgi:hypothetical protein
MRPSAWRRVDPIRDATRSRASHARMPRHVLAGARATRNPRPLLPPLRERPDRAEAPRSRWRRDDQGGAVVHRVRARVFLVHTRISTSRRTAPAPFPGGRMTSTELRARRKSVGDPACQRASEDVPR